ncbi:RidA family protein [Aerococcaceae bacterium DSM 111021]|nr:RidA family protein [Aerococcaceae bacterium DSM 111021]
MKKVYYSNKAPKPMDPYSQAVRVGDVLYVSGQIGIDPVTNKLVNGNAGEETKQVFKNLSHILDAAGLNLTSVVKVVLYMNDIGDSSMVNEVYAMNFQKPYPARSSFAVGSLPLGAKVKIDVIAHYES